jgi:hypothetical protein
MGEMIRKSQEMRKRQFVRRGILFGIVAVVLLVVWLYDANIIPHMYYYNGLYQTKGMETESRF